MASDGAFMLPPAVTEISYSYSPAATVDLGALTRSRFLLQRQRLLPYRDVLGRVNLNLVQASLDALRSGRVTAGDKTPEITARLVSWEKHAQKNLAEGPEDERMTLDEMRAALVPPSAPEPPPSVGAKRPAAASTAAAKPRRRRLVLGRASPVETRAGAWPEVVGNSAASACRGPGRWCYSCRSSIIGAGGWRTGRAASRSRP